jgi:hypothetical protein
LRILLLGAVGVAVYLKFDTVAASRAMQGLKQPRQWFDNLLHANAAPLPLPASPMALGWSVDSMAVSVNCPSRPEACLGEGFPLGREPAGTLREFLGKVSSQWNADARNGFTAGYHRAAAAVGEFPSWELVKLELRGAQGELALEAVPGKPATVLCAGSRCLDEMKPQAPLPGFRQVLRRDLPAPIPSGFASAAGTVPSARFLPAAGNAVRSILRGRVVTLPGPGEAGQWIKLHHGGNLFSYYRGFARLDTALRAGAMVAAGDTLGWLAAPGDSAAALDLRIEADGSAMDPLAFLGLPAAGKETALAR